MITVHLPEDLAREVGIAPHSHHESRQSLGDLLEAVDAAAPGLLRRILQAGGELRPHLNVFVGERLIGREQPMSAPLRDGDEVWLLRAVSGG